MSLPTSPTTDQTLPDVTRPMVWVMPSHHISDRDVTQLVTAISKARETRKKEKGPFVVGIDGRSGSGKSELAKRLMKEISHTEPSIRTSLFHLENLYPGWDGLAAGVEIFAGIMDNLLQNRDATWHAWDWTSNALDTTEHILKADADVIVVEGVGASAPGHPTCTPHFGVWLHLDAEIRKARALKRDGDLYRPYWNQWAEQEERLFSS